MINENVRDSLVSKIGVYLFLILSSLGVLAFIITSIKKDRIEMLKLKNHKILENRDQINSQVHVDTTIKGYIYITLRDGSQYIIGPTKKLTTKNKIYEHVFSGDSLIKYSGYDTLYVIKGWKNPEKFLLLY